MYRDIYLHDQVYIPGALQSLLRKTSRSLLHKIFKLVLQLRLDNDQLRNLTDDVIEYKLFDDHRNKCYENEADIIKELEKMCTDFLVAIVGETRGLKLQYTKTGCSHDKTGLQYYKIMMATILKEVYKDNRKLFGGNDTEDEEEEQIFAKSSIVRKPKYKKIVQKEELLPE